MCAHEEKGLTKRKKAGLFLIVASWVIYGIIFIIPFLSLDIKLKAFICTALFFSSHAAFWIGVSILGKEMINRYKALIPLSWIRRPWIKR